MFPARQEVGPAAAAAAFQYAAATCYPTSCSPPPQYAGFGPAVHGGLVDAVDWTGGGYRYDDWATLQQQQQQQPTAQGLYGGYAAVPEPPTTSPDSGLAPSDLSGGTPSPGLVQPQPVSRPAPARSPYEWMMKPSYQVQPNPGKTRTKDKYRVVYSDHQRLELEKEFHYSRYITIRRKAELAAMLGLSERQVKIWFQNRRAKDRKQAKKQEEMLHRELVKAEPVPTATLPPFSAAAAPTDGYS
ncbi:homeobox protein CDX-1-like isoform X2 [Dermacentor andersoni]|uniref:homeobox protein CDX-1-like isoform X2 n=1 Tax=Dermacentor andersoni TaxID=34620 RepID=UPI00215581E9|nr:homeobox protein CDX-1-like isoform X2 [Dermacentor andersoni]